ncbi:unnamed protein product [Hymenolepis diminuta]|uniref:Uncharacterized protein n=1 Tax=Hymenolepis diminuta TaxID=6216 RepID=A0A564XU83_HYMDI|nr:unnamed protein product [Hymenolepis diminuta]
MPTIKTSEIKLLSAKFLTKVSFDVSDTSTATVSSNSSEKSTHSTVILVTFTAPLTATLVQAAIDNMKLNPSV